MRFFIQIGVLFVFLFFGGCATKTVPVYTVINTPKLKVADQGFIKSGFGYKQIIIYKDANVPVRITVNNSQICMNDKCMDKKRFVKKFLPENYPVDFFDKILNYQCPKGFFCITNGKKILFKDKKNKITIMIKNID